MWESFQVDEDRDLRKDRKRKLKKKSKDSYKDFSVTKEGMTDMDAKKEKGEGKKTESSLDVESSDSDEWLDEYGNVKELDDVGDANEDSGSEVTTGGKEGSASGREGDDVAKGKKRRRKKKKNKRRKSFREDDTERNLMATDAQSPNLSDPQLQSNLPPPPVPPRRKWHQGWTDHDAPTSSGQEVSRAPPASDFVTPEKSSPGHLQRQRPSPILMPQVSFEEPRLSSLNQIEQQAFLSLIEKFDFFKVVSNVDDLAHVTTYLCSTILLSFML